MITDERAEQISEAVDKWEMRDRKDLVEFEFNFFKDFGHREKDRQKLADEIEVPLTELTEWFNRVKAGNGEFL